MSGVLASPKYALDTETAQKSRNTAHTKQEIFTFIKFSPALYLAYNLNGFITAEYIAQILIQKPTNKEKKCQKGINSG
jgi:hypothetical protein